MLNPKHITPSHEDLFIQRYKWLLGWSLRLTGYDQQQAEDLLHDAFVQFTLVRPDLGAIQNLEGYLYEMLRNMHLSQVRRAARRQTSSLSLVDYDSAEVGIRAVDPRDQIQAKDQLHAICHYACLRKDTSKSGSVLILRFFHGYYPSEIAKILRSPRRAIDDWMRIARREAKLYLERPRHLNRVVGHSITDVIHALSGQTFLGELRDTIFRSRQGNCLSVQRLHELYRSAESEAVDCRTLAHIVSCSHCLDEVNRLLGLPPLSDRYPTDMIGPNSRARDRMSSDKEGPAPGDEKDLHRQTKQVYQHNPRELHLLVNGFLVGSQTVNSALSDHTVSINIAEKVGFIEVFSEQGIRLLSLNVDPPPAGAVEQLAHVELSDGRTLDLNLNFCDAWAKARTTYQDPLFNPLLSAQPGIREEETASPSIQEKSEEPRDEARVVSWRHLPRILEWFVGLRSWLRPSTVTGIVAVVLISILVLLRINAPSVSAAGLLRRAARLEHATLEKPEVVIHRMFNLEERHPDGALISRHKIEMWVSADKGIRARRVYDERAQLIAGEWTSSQGPRIIYRHGAEPQTQSSLEAQADALLQTGDIWQLDPSASAFSVLIANAEMATVEEKAAAYVVSYQSGAKGSGSEGRKLLKATLTISKVDLHPIEMVLLIQNGTGFSPSSVQYRFVESSIEQRPPDSVAPSVFQPEPELVSGRVSNESSKITEGNIAHPSSLISDASSSHLSPAALVGFEIDALYQLHQIGACIREQVELARTADGGLRLSAIVESERRKAEVLQALGPVMSSPAMKVEVSTVAEAMKQEMERPSGPPLARKVEIRRDRIPVYAQLRQYFFEQSESAKSSEEKRSSENRAEEEVRRFAGRALNGSRRALIHAWALKHLVEKFSADELATLASAQAVKWRSMLREHARMVQQETRTLRFELQPVFFPTSTDEGGQSIDVSQLRRAIENLIDLASFNEQAIRGAFSVSPEGAATSVIGTEQFWRSLRDAEKLAARIEAEP